MVSSQRPGIDVKMKRTQACSPSLWVEDDGGRRGSLNNSVLAGFGGRNAKPFVPLGLLGSIAQLLF